MKHSTWVIGVLIAMGHLPAVAQRDPHYGVKFFADAGGTSCTVDANQPGMVSVHVFHTGSGPSSALLFAAYIPDCWPGAVWLGDVLAEPWLTIGDTQQALGLSIGYGECRPLPLYVGHIDFLAPGGTPACCELAVTHPTSWTYYTEPVLATDCDFREWRGTGGRVVINANRTCLCEQPLAVHESTWGRVKALYR